MSVSLGVDSAQRAEEFGLLLDRGVIVTHKGDIDRCKIAIMLDKMLYGREGQPCQEQVR
jgi:hypothetical protein